MNIVSTANFLFLINKANGDFIWLVGDDDILREGLLYDLILALNSYSDLGYIFINYECIHKEGIKNSRLPSVQNTYFSPGEMFNFIVNNCGFGATMFIASNIFRKEYVMETNTILKDNDELDNMALALGYGLMCSKLGGYCITKESILDDCIGISWSRYAVLVHCRDMLVIYDLVAKTFLDYDTKREFFLKHLPQQAPEYIYMLYMHRYKKATIH